MDQRTSEYLEFLELNPLVGDALGSQIEYEDWYNPSFIMHHSPAYRQAWSSAINGFNVVTLWGGRGTAKSHFVWSYGIELCLSMNNFTMGIARETYSKVNDTLLGTLQKMSRYPLSDKRLPFVVKHYPTRLYFPSTGSKIVLMGLQNPEELRGHELNLLWLEEATKIKKSEVLGIAIGSMFGGRGSAEWIVDGEDFYQIWLVCNPDRQDNWVHQHEFSEENIITQEDLGPDIDIKDVHYKKLWLKTELEDNPINSDDGINLHESGKRRKASLFAGLVNQPSHIYRRDALSEWCSAEGLVYQLSEENILTEKLIKEKWGMSVNEITENAATKDAKWELRRVCDWGNRKPNVCLWIAYNYETRDRLVYREWRKTNCGEDVMPTAIDEHTAGEKISRTIIDHDKQKLRALTHHGIKATFARKGDNSLEMGIALANGALRRGQEGKQGGLYFLTDSPERGERGLVCNSDPHPDAKLWPRSTPQEGFKLEWKKDSDKPESDGDDGFDCVRYELLYDNITPQRINVEHAPLDIKSNRNFI